MRSPSATGVVRYRGSVAAALARQRIYYGWIVVAVAFVTLAIGTNIRAFFSLLFPPILDEFGWDRSLTAAAFSLGFVAATLYAPFLGLAMRRIGPRYLLAGAALVTGAGLALTTLASQAWHLHLTLGVLAVGASSLLSYVGHFAFLPNWFERRRGLAIGIAVSGVGVGSILILPWAQDIILDRGWREACWLFAGLLVVTLVPLNLLFQRERPEDLGLRADGAVAASGVRDGPARAAATVRSAPATGPWTLSRAAGTLRFWLIAGAFFCAMFAWYAVLVHQTKFLLDAGIGAGQAAYALGFVGLLGIVGQIGLGHLSDRIGREWIWTSSCLGFAACYGLLLLIEQHPSLLLVYLMVAAQGLFGYALASVYSAVPAEVFAGPSYATIFGSLTVAGNLGAATGPWLVGKLYDASGSYDLAFTLTIGLCGLSCACIWLVARHKARPPAAQSAT